MTLVNRTVTNPKTAETKFMHSTKQPFSLVNDPIFQDNLATSHCCKLVSNFENLMGFSIVFFLQIKDYLTEMGILILD